MFNTRRSLCLLLAGAALAPVAMPARAGVLASPLGYTVTIPHGWQTKHEVDPNPSGYATDMTFSHPPNSFPCFRVEVDAQRAATVDREVSSQAEFVRTNLPGFQTIEQRRCRVSGEPASEMAVSGSYKGVPVIMDMILTIHKGRIYTITLMTTPASVKPDFVKFGDIMATFHWAKAD